MIVDELTPEVNFGISWIKVLEKIFWATEIEMAPPRVLEKMARASEADEAD